MQALITLDLFVTDYHTASVIVHLPFSLKIKYLTKLIIQLQIVISYLLKQNYRSFDNYYLQFLMDNVRRIQGTGNIQRPEEYQYTNTTYLPHERTINSVSYYNRRKNQLKRHPSNEVIINLTNRNASRPDLRSHIQTTFKSNITIDPFIANYIKEMRAVPVITDNKFTNFNEDLYPLNQDQKVKVLQERYFPLQNYHNYIQDLELKKELSRFVIEDEDPAVREAQKVKNSNKSIKLQQSQISKTSNQLNFQHILHEESGVRDKRIKGYYASRFEPKQKNKKTDTNPTEIQFQDHYSRISASNYRFSVNENQRLQLSNQIRGP